MRSYWTSRRRTTPWTGTGAWTYWQYTAWAPGKSGFSECTGAGLPWWKSLKGKTPPFMGFRGVIQGEPLLPKICNVVVNDVMYHWVTVVSEEEVVPEVLG